MLKYLRLNLFLVDYYYSNRTKSTLKQVFRFTNFFYLQINIVVAL